MSGDRKTVMIFGAGFNQLELIREARKLGLTTVVIDPQSDPVGKQEADFFHRVDGNDYEMSRSLALKYKVGGIVTGQMEKPLRLMSRLAKEMGFIFNSPQITETCLDKWLMKRVLQSGNVQCAKGILIGPNDELTQKLPDDLIFPIIIKPRDSFSSRGVYKCDSYKELCSHVDDSRNYSTNRDIIIEEFLEGKEYSVEAITFRGKTTIIQFTKKFITQYPYTVELGHLQPADLTPGEKESIQKLLQRQ